MEYDLRFIRHFFQEFLEVLNTASTVVNSVKMNLFTSFLRWDDLKSNCFTSDRRLEQWRRIVRSCTSSRPFYNIFGCFLHYIEICFMEISQTNRLFPIDKLEVVANPLHEFSPFFWLNWAVPQQQNHIRQSRFQLDNCGRVFFCN